MAAERLDLAWNVYYHDFNKREIRKFNIFDHWKFNEDVSKDLYKCRSREEFAKFLRGHLFYYFNSKCEYEVLISPWIGDREKGTIKVDVYDQVMMNWEIFLDYCWTH